MKHYTLNDSLNSVSKEWVEVDGVENRVHTNGIKSDWQACKRRFKNMNGCDRAYWQSYIKKFCWEETF